MLMLHADATPLTLPHDMPLLAAAMLFAAFSCRFSAFQLRFIFMMPLSLDYCCRCRHFLFAILRRLLAFRFIITLSPLDASALPYVCCADYFHFHACY